MKKIILAVTSSFILGACAQKSEDIAAAYVSPMEYESHSCKQLGLEAQRISSRAVAASQKQDAQASNDATATAAALILWPALFFIDGDDENAAELSRLKGEMDAIEAANIQKNCGITFDR